MKNLNNASRDLKEYVETVKQAFNLNELDTIRLLQELALELLQETTEKRSKR